MATDNPVLEPADVFYGATEEPELTEPTETEAVTNGDDQNTEETEITDQPEELEAKAEDETEEAEGDDETEAAEDEDEEHVYLELDGKDVDLEDVRKWRDGHLMQSDYTRKTQELADERKGLKAQSDEVADLRTNLIETQAELKALVEEDEAVDWDELREIDPDEYIKLKEKADKRKAAVTKFKAESTQPDPITKEEIEAEQVALFGMHPSWTNDKGESTEEMTADTTLLNNYWNAAGFTPEEISGMAKARYVETCLKAAKFDELQEKSKSFKKRAKKATLVTKPKPQSRKVKGKPKTHEEVFYDS